MTALERARGHELKEDGVFKDADDEGVDFHKGDLSGTYGTDIQTETVTNTDAPTRGECRYELNTSMGRRRL